MSLDHLLIWLSAKREGSWTQFRTAVEELHVQSERDSPGDPDANESSGSDLSTYHETRFAFQRLAHVEFSTRGDALSWRVVPPSLAFLPGPHVQGLLCGARSPSLIERLHDIAFVEELTVDGMPMRIVLSGTSKQAMIDSATTSGLRVQDSAPSSLLYATPNVRDRGTWVASPMPDTPGWLVSRFSPRRLKWQPVSQAEALRASSGFYRFDLAHQRFHYLRKAGRTYRLPVQVGKFAVLGRRHATIGYETANARFSVPAICRPPLLIERALVLCSGLLPQFDQSTYRVSYVDVPPDLARLAAQLLRQDLQ